MRATRSAWQFAPIGPVFDGLYAKHKAAFRSAIPDLGFPATFFGVPYRGKSLPGLFVQNADRNAPVVLLLGGADTCFEEIFLTVGRNVYDQGYSVAMIDLPGQGLTMKDGLHWEAETEKPIGAVIDMLIERFGARTGRIGMLGYSLGGYFVTRAAGYERRLGAVMASTPLPHVGLGFPELVKRWRKEDSEGKMSSATRRNVDVIYWKMGASNDEEFIAKASRMIADPSLVTVPFLSIVGTGEGPGFQYDGKNWHETIRSTQKRFVALDASTGADGHVQAANRLRLAQEMCGWMDTILAVRVGQLNLKAVGGLVLQDERQLFGPALRDVQSDDSGAGQRVEVRSDLGHHRAQPGLGVGVRPGGRKSPAH